MTNDEANLPVFRYFPDPLANGCIQEKKAECPCCGLPRGYMYVGPVYCTEQIEQVCPWCIADGPAAAKWSAAFNDVYEGPDVLPDLPDKVLQEIMYRTPGYQTWQGNTWLFSSDDAMVFVGEVDGCEVLKEGNADKIKACMKALGATGSEDDWSIEDLKTVERGGAPAIYLFQDREIGEFAAYMDMC